MKTDNTEISPSWVTDPKQERKRVAGITFAAWAGATGYIVMIFIAMPFAIHYIVNEENNDCDPDCFSPTSRSIEFLTTTLTSLRLTTFAIGSLVGVMSDRYGRKPLLIGAIVGYLLTGVLFSIGWSAKEKSIFLIGAIILGASSPINPHAIAYVSDISKPDRLARNMGILQGMGYFFGLMSGAVTVIVLGGIILGSADLPSVDQYSTFFYTAFGFGIGLSTLALAVILVGVPESLAESERKEVDWQKANPLGFVNYLIRNPYLSLLFTTGIISWATVGASEVVTGGWWLRRYGIPEINEFFQFIVVVWVVSALGAVFCTVVYQKFFGLKTALHLSFFFTIISGVAFALAPDYIYSYISIIPVFFSTALYPLFLAVLMGQVDSKEKGSLAGAIRSAEALSKTIGILIFGYVFSEYLKPFTPDASCIPDPLDRILGSSQPNTCECGIESCPDIRTVPTFYPAECTTGQLSMKINGKISKFVKTSEFPGYPQKWVDRNNDMPYSLFPGIDRDGECKGSGLVTGTKGFTTSLPRAWCASEQKTDVEKFGQLYVLDQTLSSIPNYITFNSELGCPGLDLLTASNDAYVQLNEICVNGDALGAATYMPSFDGTVPENKTGQEYACGVIFNPAGLNTTTNATLANLTTGSNDNFRKYSNNHFEPFNSFLDLATNSISKLNALNILDVATRVQGLPTGDTEADEVCPDYENLEDAEVNVCLEGPIAEFPGLIPLIYGSVLPLFAWIVYATAELLFKAYDGKYWSDKDVLTEDAKVENVAAASI